MGFRVKPWTTITIILVTICILFSVGILTYHWKLKTVTHHADPHHITGGGDSTNHTDYESKYPNNDSVKGHHHSTRSTTETTTVTPICQGFEWECQIRLEKNVYPVHYDVYLNPDPENGVFTGRVEMVLNVSKTIDHVRVHMKGLDITHNNLSRNNIQIDIQEMLVYEPNEFLVFRVSKSLEPAQYKLVIDFKGNLTRGIVGLYRSQYADPIKNITRYVVSSKFQPTYARRAFPCMDEPGFKSTFSVSIVKPTDLIALSNMPVSKEIKDKPTKGFTTVHFEKSVPMVTYLVAVAIGDFNYRSARTKRGVPVRVFATRFQANKTQYAVDVAPSMIDFYEEYFGIKYPLPKMDIIGIPDFVSGAMEHWGMISFRESNLLYHSDVSSAANKQRIATVIAHEIAHMWFGNLVTLKWWSDLWLNEGFASYCEYKAVNHVHPDWEILTQFVSQDLTPVLVLDGKLSSHPIVQTVSHPDQITEIFDTISYNKGASVIRMLENFIGANKFQDGVRKFLKAFSYGNADTANLWSALESEVGPGINITLLMDTWTRQMGYPILHVEKTNQSIIVRQERFFENPQHDFLLPDTPFNFTWEIPLRIVRDNDNKTLQMNLMAHTQHTLTLPIQNSTKWVKLNADYFGYFRVKYPETMWRRIMSAFRSSFTPAERCGLIDDIFSLAYSQQLGYDLALEFGQGLRRDVHLVPWDCAENHFWQISALLEKSSSPDAYFLFRKYITNLTSTLNRNFNWTDGEGENHLNRLLKIKIFLLSCYHGESTCLRKSQKLFNDWIEKGVVVPAGLRPVVYKWGMWQASEDVWDTLWSRYIQESDSQERTRLLSGLASTQYTWVIRRFINLAGNETLVRRQDYFTAMNFVSLNPIGNSIIWTYYRNEYENLVKRFTVNDRYFGKMILGITSDYSSEIQLQEMETFFATYPNAGAGKRARKTALETVKNNIQWAKRNVPVIRHWLNTNI